MSKYLIRLKSIDEDKLLHCAGVAAKVRYGKVVPGVYNFGIPGRFSVRSSYSVCIEKDHIYGRYYEATIQDCEFTVLMEKLAKQSIMGGVDWVWDELHRMKECGAIDFEVLEWPGKVESCAG